MGGEEPSQRGGARDFQASGFARVRIAFVFFFFGRMENQNIQDRMSTTFLAFRICICCLLFCVSSLVAMISNVHVCEILTL